jgi:hypothetical protein
VAEILYGVFLQTNGMSGKNQSINKKWKWIAGIIGAIILLFGGAAIYLAAKLKPILRDKIKAGIYEGSNHLYKIDFKDIHLNLLLGNATLTEVTLTPDTAVFDSLKRNKMAPSHLLKLSLANLEINRAGVYDAYFKKKLHLNALELHQPSINYIYHQVEKKAEPLPDEKTLYEQISATFKSVHVKRISIIDADFVYTNGDTGRKQHTIKHFNLNVQDFLLDSLAHQDTSKVFYTKDIVFKLVGYQSLSADRMYTLKADTLTGSVRNKTLRVGGFKMIPMHSDLAFSRKYKTQKDRFDLNFKELVFNGIDFVKLNQDGSVHAQSLSVGPAKAAIFMNRELPPPNIDKGRNYPHVALQRLPLQVHLDTLRLKNIHVAYTEYNPITQKRGTIDLEHLKGTVLNVTNDSLQLTKNNHTIANLSTTIIKAAKINIRLDFNLTAKNGAFSYRGDIGPMEMTALNSLSKPLGLVKIEQGKVQRASFDIKGNLKGSSGTMRFLYKDLKITMLKEGEEGEPVKEKGFLSFLANTIIIADANPSKGEEVRVANITFERTPAASFFNLLWKGVFVGIRETVGIGMVPVKSPEQAFDKVTDKKEERKEKREKRRAERAKKAADKAAEKEEESAKDKDE